MAWKKQEGKAYWNPEIGKSIEGTVTKIEETKEYGMRYSIKKADGEIVVTPSHKVLQNRMSGAREGTKVRMTYVRDELPTIKGNKATKIYDVEFDE